MLTQVCQYLRNWFELSKYFASFKIVGGVMTFDDGSALPLLDGQYYRIIGSVFNDGVHRYGDNDLEDEEFAGSVWSMGIPQVVVELADDIEQWVSANQNALSSPYASESFGGYSYSLRAGSGLQGDTGGVTWQSQFSARLSPWRKI